MFLLERKLTWKKYQQSDEGDIKGGEEPWEKTKTRTWEKYKQVNEAWSEGCE